MMKKARPTAKGQVLHPEVVEQIKALYASGMTKQGIADQLDLSWSTVDKYCQPEMDALEELREERRKKFIEACWRNITDAIELGNQKVNIAKMASKDFKKMVEKTEEELRKSGAAPEVIAEAVKAMAKMGDIPLAHISTYIGTLYDKQALAQGDPTEITENITRWSDLDD